MRQWFVILFYFLLLQNVFANLSDTEKTMTASVTAEQAAQLNFLKTLVDMNSGTTNLAGVKAVGALVEKELTDLGFVTHWTTEPVAMQRAGMLIANHSGNKNKKCILLIAHLDTVFPKESHFQQFNLRQHTAKGPGILDDKGGIVVMLYALKALKAAGVLADANITVVLTGDEEDAGKPTTISRAPLREIAKNCAVALDFEPALSFNSATIARRGISNWQIKVTGNESHSATIFQHDVGAGAIFELARILNTMREQLRQEKNISFNPGLILGGTTLDYDAALAQGKVFGKQNVVAKAALVTGDLRFLNTKEQKKIENKMRTIVKKHLTGTSAKIEFIDAIPAMPPTKQNLQLLKKYSAVSKDLNAGIVVPLDPNIRGAGDIAHVATIIPANLSGLGPVGVGSHSVIESVDLESLPLQTKRAAIFIYRLTH